MLSRAAVCLLLTTAVLSAQKSDDRAMPTLAAKQEPVYSQDALSYRVEGEVWLGVMVTKAGLADEIVVMRSVGFGLDEQAIAAVRAWRFNPAMKNSKAVEKFATIAVSFHMQGGGTNFQSELREYFNATS